MSQSTEQYHREDQVWIYTLREWIKQQPRDPRYKDVVIWYYAEFKHIRIDLDPNKNRNKEVLYIEWSYPFPFTSREFDFFDRTIRKHLDDKLD